MGPYKVVKPCKRSCVIAFLKQKVRLWYFVKWHFLRKTIYLFPFHCWVFFAWLDIPYLKKLPPIEFEKQIVNVGYLPLADIKTLYCFKIIQLFSYPCIYIYIITRKLHSKTVHILIFEIFSFDDMIMIYCDISNNTP